MAPLRFISPPYLGKRVTPDDTMTPLDAVDSDVSMPWVVFALCHDIAGDRFFTKHWDHSPRKVLDTLPRPVECNHD